MVGRSLERRAGNVQSETPSENTEGSGADAELEGAPGEAQPWEPPSVTPSFSPGFLGIGEPLFEPEESTPLETDEPEGTIPPCPLWAMKDRRHVQWSDLVGFPPKRIREAFAVGDDAVYAIDDGHHHVIVGRAVGTVLDGCHYALVGRAPLSMYEGFRDGQLSPAAAFNDAEDVVLCGIDIDEQDKASDIFVVDFYGAGSTVPPAYLPGRPAIEFAEPLPISEL
jgi:hypothetical protein